METERPTVLRIEELAVSFDTEDGAIAAVDTVSLEVRRGEVLGLVGESGCGKSVTALSVLRLIPSPPGRIVSGRIWFEGHDLRAMPMERIRQVRGQKISMIFQEPMTALSPLHLVGDQVCEAVLLHRSQPLHEVQSVAREWLRRVGIPDPERCMESYPHQLSGGMRQRVVIAMALTMNPALLIADEPTTALDVTIQAQVLDLLRDIKGPGMAILFITHDMGIVWELCDRVAVMYAGEVVEEGGVQDVFAAPAHPYTEALLGSIPARTPKGKRLVAIPGQVSRHQSGSKACRFADRCRYAGRQCLSDHPAMRVSGERAARCVQAARRFAGGAFEGVAS